MTAGHLGPIVVAVGGNALLRRGGADDLGAEQQAAALTARALAPLVRDGTPLVVTHGNGPQVGALAMGAELAGRAVPLSVLVAESQGHIGHLLQVELAAVGAGREVCCVLTHVVVDDGSPAGVRPTKPVGAVVDEARAASLAAEHGWTMRADGTGWRRVVPSPEPTLVVEVATIRRLVAAGVVVIAAGGGGIPLASAGGRPVDAVVDKDLTSALLAVELGASGLVLLTDVDGVHDGWGGPGSSVRREATVGELRAEVFEAGTMGPKVEAACRFVAATGRRAHIGSLDDAAAVVAGSAGTVVRP